MSTVKKMLTNTKLCGYLSAQDTNNADTRNQDMNVQQTNADAKRCLALVVADIDAIDFELNQLVDDLVAGRVTELHVKVREMTLRKRRDQFEAIRKALYSCIKDF